jgi:F0F1-type ATP synthase assembly protein I
MTDENKTKKKSNVGMGIVFGFIIGAALGFALDNFALWAGIGMSLGIVIGAIMDMNQNKKSSDEEEDAE